MTLAPPVPQELVSPGTIRWFVGEVEGPRSATWSIVGASNAPEAYVSVRDRMGEVKLSLHSAMTRLAYTSEWWQTNAEDPTADRLVLRWPLTRPFAEGWRRALAITIPHSSLGVHVGEKAPKDGNLSGFPSPGTGHALRFDVLMPEAGASSLTMDGTVGEVGRMPLGQGGAIWIIASDIAVSGETEAEWEAMREGLRREAGNTAHVGALRSWAWGEIDDGTPAALDLGPI